MCDDDTTFTLYLDGTHYIDLSSATGCVAWLVRPPIDKKEKDNDKDDKHDKARSDTTKKPPSSKKASKPSAKKEKEAPKATHQVEYELIQSAFWVGNRQYHVKKPVLTSIPLDAGLYPLKCICEKRTIAFPQREIKAKANTSFAMS